MDSSETEYDKRRTLEFEKLQLEIYNLAAGKANRLKPISKRARIANNIQPWLPACFTAISIAIFYWLLFQTKLFEKANTLYEYKNSKLKDEQRKLEDDSAHLAKLITTFQDTITNQRTDSRNLLNQINNYKRVLQNNKDTITVRKKQMANLNKERDRLLGNK